MTRSRWMRLTREVLLTATAVIGGVCLLLTLLGFAFGVHPLMFRSGSMSPTIDTGDIAFARTVAASSVSKGDIVSLIAPSGERVTHRVVDNTGVGSHRKLTLKGDANQVIDPMAYDATTVQKVFFHVPKVGYAVAWLSQAPGVYLVAGYVALMLLLLGRNGTPGNDDDRRSAAEEPARRDAAPEPGPGTAPPGPIARSRRRRALVVVAVTSAFGLLLAAAVSWAMPTWAAWTDAVPITGQNLNTGTWGVPAAPVITACTRNTGSGEITVTWSSVSGATSYNVKLSNPASTLVGKSSPFTTTTIGKNNSGTVAIVAVNASGSSPDSVAWTYDGTGSNQACHS